MPELQDREADGAEAEEHEEPERDVRVDAEAERCAEGDEGAYAVPDFIMLYYTILYCMLLYYTILYYIILDCTITHYSVRDCNILSCNITYHSIMYIEHTYIYIRTDLLHCDYTTYDYTTQAPGAEEEVRHQDGAVGVLREPSGIIITSIITITYIHIDRNT